MADNTGDLSTTAFKLMRALGFCTETGKKKEALVPN